MAERKDRMALLSRYSKYHTAKYEQKPVLNLNVEQWASDALIESYGIHTCYDLLQYYFEVSANPSWKYFANYADKIYQARIDKELDSQERKERRAMARKWLSE